MLAREAALNIMNKKCECIKYFHNVAIMFCHNVGSTMACNIVCTPGLGAWRPGRPERPGWRGRPGQPWRPMRGQGGRCSRGRCLSRNGYRGACVCMCVHVCVWVCVCACVRERVHVRACVHELLAVCICTDLLGPAQPSGQS